MEDLKVCRGCHEAKPKAEYNKHRDGKDGLRPRCRGCARAEYLADRDRILADRREYWHRNPEERLAGSIRSRYNLSLDEWRALQDAGCAICGATESTGKTKTLHIDHDHACCPGKRSCGGCVRGALCTSCNQGLGRFKDDTDRLMSAVAYLLSRADVLSSGFSEQNA